MTTEFSLVADPSSRETNRKVSDVDEIVHCMVNVVCYITQGMLRLKETNNLHSRWTKAYCRTALCSFSYIFPEKINDGRSSRTMNGEKDTKIEETRRAKGTKSQSVSKWKAKRVSIRIWGRRFVRLSMSGRGRGERCFNLDWMRG